MYRSRTDNALAYVLRSMAWSVGIISLLILVFLVQESAPALRRLGFTRLFTDSSWQPAESAAGHFNIAPMLFATLCCGCGSVVLATPLGLGCALFGRQFAPQFIATPFRRMMELLAGVPSVVFGFWGLVVIVPLLNSVHPPGTSLIAGVFLLTFMVVPTVTLMADAAIASVPRDLYLAASATGLSSLGTFRAVILPKIASTVVAGGVLQTGRAIGETMAVLMVCGNVVQWPGSPFDPVRPLTANIALEMAYATGLHRSALFACGLVLMLTVLCTVLLTDLVLRRTQVS